MEPAFDENQRISLFHFMYNENLRTRIPESYPFSVLDGDNEKNSRQRLLDFILGTNVGIKSQRTPQFQTFIGDKVSLKGVMAMLDSLLRNKRKFNVQHNLTQAFKRNGLHLPNCRDTEPVPVKVVLTFVSAAVDKILPKEFLGNSNRQVQKLAREIIKEKVIPTVGFVMRFIKKDNLNCGWISEIKNTSLQMHLSALFAVWAATMLIPMLIGAAFHSTKHDFNKGIHFYTKPCWESRSTRAMQTLVEEGCLEEIKTRVKPGWKMKIIPKKDGNRVVVKKIFGYPAGNTKIERAILEKARGIKNPIDMSWFHFRNLVLESRMAGCSEEIYFVSFDVLNAYGTVDQKMLSQIFLEKTSYMIFRSIKYKKIYTILELNESTLQTIPIQKIRRSYTNGDIEDSKLMNILKTLDQKFLFGKRIFQFKKGIAQGSTFGNGLCYLALDRLHQSLKKIVTAEDKAAALLRSTDDFVLFTRNKQLAQNFLGNLKSYLEGYGWKVNESKLFHNLNEPSLTSVDFDGAIFNLKDMEVYPNFSAYSPDAILNTLNLKLFSNSKERRFWKSIGKVKCLKLSPVIFNPILSSKRAILTKVAMAGEIQALRTALAIKIFGLSSKLIVVIRNLLDSVAKQIMFRLRTTAQLCERRAEIPRLIEVKLILNKCVDKAVVPINKAMWKFHFKRKIHAMEKFCKPEDLAFLNSIDFYRGDE